MRMWMVDPKIMCRQHLLGEHSEIHKHRHNFVKKHNMNKRVSLNQIEPKSMKKRHDELAREMERRGYEHNSEYTMPDISYLTKESREYTVDTNKSYEDLIKRCGGCGDEKEST